MRTTTKTPLSHPPQVVFINSHRGQTIYNETKIEKKYQDQTNIFDQL